MRNETGRGDNLSDYVEKPVAMRTTAPHRLLGDCVLLVEGQAADGSYYPQGSAFVIQVDRILYAVTARHVVQDLTESGWGNLFQPLLIRAIRETDGAPRESFRKTLSSRWFDYSNMYVFHESDDVDVAVFPTYRSGSMAEKTKSLPIGFLQPDERVLSGEDVHLFGFPGVYGYADGAPVIRSGTIAYKMSRYAYLLDVTSWHGDSGGLVCSKPYFGVPEGELSNWQWHMGGKVIGLLQRYDPPRLYGLPEELENFRVIVSAQAIRDVFESPGFRALHDRLLEAASKEPPGEGVTGHHDSA